MHDRPTPGELLEAVQAFLRDEVLGGLQGRTRYHLLVALNLLRIARRETAQAPEQERAEWAGLRALLDDLPPDPPADGPQRRGALAEANGRLCSAIRAGAYDAGPERERLLAHLRAVTAAKLAVANPAFLERVGGAD